MLIVYGGDCIDFTDIDSIRQMVYQSPGGFEATQKDTFTSDPAKRTEGWQGKLLMASGIIRPATLSGSSCLEAAARPSGLVNGIQEGSNPTVFILLLGLLVQVCTNLLKE